MGIALFENQPIFLFKTLNDIDTLCIKSPSKASHAIIKLSEIMRYMLNDSKIEKVLLSKEIENIKNYISIQKLCFEEANNVTFKTTGNAEGVHIHPMIFFTFVENAFKHGQVTKNNCINILIEASNNTIYFKCENEKKQHQLINHSLHHGIGIENIKRSLKPFLPQQAPVKY
ncbi:MAG: histidine kinase [Chloroflexia bacterium]|nr:histidine kinase [Chloroflexia bacterium]